MVTVRSTTPRLVTLRVPVGSAGDVDVHVPHGAAVRPPGGGPEPRSPGRSTSSRRGPDVRFRGRRFRGRPLPSPPLPSPPLRSPAPSARPEVAAAGGLWAAGSAVLTRGVAGAGAVQQAVLLRAAHEARSLGLHRASTAAIRVVQAARAAHADDPAFRLADLVAALHELLEVSHRIRHGAGVTGVAAWRRPTVLCGVWRPAAVRGVLRARPRFDRVRRRGHVPDRRGRDAVPGQRRHAGRARTRPGPPRQPGAHRRGPPDVPRTRPRRPVRVRRRRRRPTGGSATPARCGPSAVPVARGPTTRSPASGQRAADRPGVDVPRRPPVADRGAAGRSRSRVPDRPHRSGRRRRGPLRHHRRPPRPPGRPDRQPGPAVPAQPADARRGDRHRPRGGPLRGDGRVEALAARLGRPPRRAGPATSTWASTSWSAPGSRLPPRKRSRRCDGGELAAPPPDLPLYLLSRRVQRTVEGGALAAAGAPRDAGPPHRRRTAHRRRPRPEPRPAGGRPAARRVRPSGRDTPTSSRPPGCRRRPTSTRSPPGSPPTPGCRPPGRGRRPGGLLPAHRAAT